FFCVRWLMGQVQRGVWSPLAVLVVAFWLLGSGTIHAQTSSSKEPTAGEFAKEVHKQMKEAEEYDPSFGGYLRLAESWAVVVVLTTIIVVVSVVLTVIARIYLRMSTTTDPTKLAMSDPWIRAHLAQQAANGERIDPPSV